MPVSISIEIELGWGTHDKPGINEALSERRKQETEALNILLTICDKFGVPISFDVVGHLFHNLCDGTHCSPHKAGWFDADPGTDMQTDPLFYAPDLIETINSARTDHEICTHTYSHALCNEISPKTLEWELSRVREVHKSAGLDAPTSFVPPRHRSVDYSILRKNGIETIRRPFPQYQFTSSDGLEGFFEQYVRSHPVHNASVVEGLVETYCTPLPSLTAPFLPNGRRYPSLEHRLIPLRVRQFVHRRYLRHSIGKVITNGKDLHLWTHLYNLANDAQLNPICWFIKLLAEKEAEGSIVTKTMEELTD